MICVRSKNKIGNIIQLDEQINGDYKLELFTFTNNLYNVNNFNNTLYIFINSQNYVINIPVGYYTYSSIIPILQNSLFSATGNTFNITFDYNTHKFTFSTSTNFQFTFLTNSDNSIGEFLGFDVDTTLDTSTTSNKPVDFNPTKIIFAQIHQDENKISLTNILQASFYFHSDVSFGNVLKYPTNYTDYAPTLHFSNINKISIDFYDVNNNKINIDNWILFLKAN